MRIIGITGQARSGKDTIGDYLCSEYGFDRMSFAAPLKRMVCALLDCSEEWINEHKEEHIPGLASPRRLLQTLGTDWGRQIIDTNIWVNIINREINLRLEAIPEFSGIVLTDCRFNNEAEWILANGGEVWKVSRPGIAPVSAHASENGIHPDLITYRIHNGGSLEDLYKQIEELY